jgi:hypothetical protein
MKIANCKLAFLSLGLLCVAAGAESIERPPELALNYAAGRGNWVILPLQMEDGEELRFVVDTGAPITVVDESLAPKLGECAATMMFHSSMGRQQSGAYVAPKLRLGGTLLQTDKYVATISCKALSDYEGERIMGVLGVDCLRHYCVQLDFQAGKMRFLGADEVNSSQLGKRFPLTLLSRGQKFPPIFAEAGQSDGLPFIQHAGLVEGKGTELLIDTGDNVDGVVEQGALKGHYMTRLAHAVIETRALRLSKCVWDGQTYAKIKVGTAEDANRLGLRFLARHVVTLDFPRKTMYLKQTSVGPLGSDAKL